VLRVLLSIPSAPINTSLYAPVLSSVPKPPKNLIASEALWQDEGQPPGLRLYREGSCASVSVYLSSVRFAGQHVFTTISAYLNTQFASVCVYFCFDCNHVVCSNNVIGV